MAINPSTNATMAGRVTAPDGNYPYGSSKNESSPGAGDGTPYFKARADDLFGWQQALLRAASIVPSGNAETALASQYMQAVVELASGRAYNYDETGVANAYVLTLRTNQQGPAGYFDGMVVEFTPGNTNSGASTINVAGLGIVDIVSEGGAALTGGELSGQIKAVFRASSGDFHLAPSGTGGLSWNVETISFAAEAGNGYLVPGGITVTLPATPTDQAEIVLADFSGAFDASPITVDGNGNNINGAATVTYKDLNAIVHLIYNGNTGEWVRVGKYQAPYVGSNGMIRLNPQLIDEDLTVPAGYNGFSTGPVTIDTGNTVTVATGATWKVG